MYIRVENILYWMWEHRDKKYKKFSKKTSYRVDTLKQFVDQFMWLKNRIYLRKFLKLKKAA